ncbi:MAG TPA: hypothetical protein VIY28_00150 [Pseudonocardiaceae bacterium]
MDRELSLEQARGLCTELLPRAPKLTTGQLIEQIKKWAIALDPQWARRRYEQALADRKVIGCRNPDGSANLSGVNLPVDRVAAASGHIDALAKAAKHADDPRPIDHIRADLFLGMTDGTYTGLDDKAILDHLRTHYNSDAPDESQGPGDTRPNNSGPGPNDGGLGEEGPDDGDDGPGDGGSGGPDDGEGPEDDEGPDGGGTAAGGGCPVDPVGRRGAVGAGMELRVRLSTLLGRDEYPGELAGWGPVHAELGRDLATTLGQAQWRYAITDQHGQLIRCGIIRARPAGTPTRSAACRAIVELQVPATTLRALSTDPTGLDGWAGVVADLASRLDDDTTSQDPVTADAARRVPGAALRRYLEIRDRSCTMPGCRAPAHTSDKDHTLDHAKGGATVGPNLGDACKHDHRLKHEGGWRLHQPQAGHFHWTSRLGHTYQVRLRPIIEPLPDPIPRHESPPPLLTPPSHDESTIWDDTPPHNDTKLSPAPPPEPDPPPF